MGAQAASAARHFSLVSSAAVVPCHFLSGAASSWLRMCGAIGSSSIAASKASLRFARYARPKSSALHPIAGATAKPHSAKSAMRGSLRRSFRTSSRRRKPITTISNSAASMRGWASANSFRISASAPGVRDLLQVDHDRPIRQIPARREIVDAGHDNRAAGVEARITIIRVQLAPADAAAGGEPAKIILNSSRKDREIVENDDRGLPPRQNGAEEVQDTQSPEDEHLDHLGGLQSDFHCKNKPKKWPNWTRSRK